MEKHSTFRWWVMNLVACGVCRLAISSLLTYTHTKEVFQWFPEFEKTFGGFANSWPRVSSIQMDTRFASSGRLNINSNPEHLPGAPSSARVLCAAKVGIREANRSCLLFLFSRGLVVAVSGVMVQATCARHTWAGAVALSRDAHLSRAKNARRRWGTRQMFRV